MGGNSLCDNSVRAIRGYDMQVKSVSTRAREMTEDDIIIEFTEQEVENLDWPHIDVIVIKFFFSYPKKIRGTTTQRTEKYYAVIERSLTFF